MSSLNGIYSWELYLGTVFNYNLISNCCQFLMAFINRTTVLVGIVMFKAR